MSLKYTQTAYYDATASASCVGSALYMTSVGTGCNSAVSDNTNSRTCIPVSDNSALEYKYYSSSCSNDPIDFGSSMRTYLVRSEFAGSDSCVGDPLQITAVAADATCHYLPGTSDSPLWFKVNCNGDQPIWSTCKDSRCSDCEEKRYTRDSCQLTAAGASTLVKCVTPASRSTNSTSSPSNTSSIVPKSTESGDPLTFGSSSRRNVTSDLWLVIVLGLGALMQIFWITEVQNLILV